MNGYRIARSGAWTSGLLCLLSRSRPTTHCPSCHSRGQTTTAASAAAAGKPRQTAADLARKIQIQKEKEKTKTKPPAAPEARLSAQQQRVSDLKRFTQQLQNVHPNVLAKHLHRMVLYQNRELVLVNKPFGVPVRDGSDGTSIQSVLPALSKLMDGMKVKSHYELLLCLTLEKEVTGVLPLARSEKAVEHMLELRRYNKLESKYWAITVGVPVPAEGVIDIPIIEKEVEGPRPHFKMTLSPVFKMNDLGDGVTKVRGNRQARPAVTRYRVLDSSSGCSLVELQPLTGVKHQMRVHMASALSCPILGDHKYSHSSKLAPQELPERVLGKLGLEQSKSRHLPLHLHARQLIIPPTSGTEVNVSCPLPKYFTQSLKRLYLTLPDKKDES